MPKKKKTQTIFSLVMVAGNICFVIGNKGSTGVKKVSEKRSVKQTREQGALLLGNDKEKLRKS